MRIFLGDEVGKPLVTYEGKHIYEVNGTYLSIVKSIENGGNTFTQMYKSHSISSRTLAEKLNHMIECEILMKKENPESKRSTIYELNASREFITSVPYTDTILLLLTFIAVKIGIFFTVVDLNQINMLIDAVFLSIILGYSVFVRRKYKIPKK